MSKNREKTAKYPLSLPDVVLAFLDGGPRFEEAREILSQHPNLSLVREILLAAFSHFDPQRTEGIPPTEKTIFYRVAELFGERIENREVWRPLMLRLRAEENPQVRRGLIAALSYSDNQRFTNIFLDAIRSDPDFLVKLEAAQALYSRIRMPSVQEELCEIWRGEDAMTKKCVFWAVCFHSDKGRRVESIKRSGTLQWLVIAAAKDADSENRARAVPILRALGDEASRNILYDLIGDSSRYVAECAFKALEELERRAA